MKPTKPKLKPCPFCGSTDIVIAQTPEFPSGGYMLCRGCYATTRSSTYTDEAVANWNRRVDDTPHGDCVKCMDEPDESCPFYGEPDGCNDRELAEKARRNAKFGEMIGREAACKEPSQVGNAAKMREALSDACYAMHNFLKTKYGGYEEMAKALDKAKASLAAPPRNCDVGTAEEQARRFYSFCKKFQSGIQGMCSSQCPCKECCDMCHCQLKWAQMPYEEGGAK